MWCDRCDFITDSAFRLQSHIEESHKNIACDKCDFVTQSSSELIDHHSQIHLLTCAACDFTTDNNFKLLSHSDRAHKKQDSALKCDNCAFSTTEATDLARHARLVHLAEKRYKCDQCDFSSFHKHSLMSHIEENICSSKSSGASPALAPLLSCKLCNFASPSPFSIIDHLMQSHVSKGSESETKSSKKAQSAPQANSIS